MRTTTLLISLLVLSAACGDDGQNAGDASELDGSVTDGAQLDAGTDADALVCSSESETAQSVCSFYCTTETVCGDTSGCLDACKLELEPRTPATRAAIHACMLEHVNGDDVDCAGVDACRVLAEVTQCP